MAGLFTFIVSGAGFAWHNLQTQIHTVAIDNLLDGDRPTRADATATGLDDSYEGRAVNILVLGSDSREGTNNIDDSEGTAATASARSDTAMVMHISADRERIDVVSIPRDTLVDIPSCTQSDGTKTYAQSSAMFNAAFANGAGDGDSPAHLAAGAACTIKTVEQLTGLYIDEYVIVDFTGLTNMVNALGGVTLYVSEPIDDSYTGLQLDVGCHKLNGTEALAYARVRHGVSDGSDLSRITRQQNFMAAMIRTAQNKNMLTNLDELYSFAKAALGTLTTSPKIGSLTVLAGLASSAANIGLDNINFVTMPYAVAPSDPNRVIPDSSADEVWQALVNDTAIPNEIESSKADGSTAKSSTSPSDASSSDAVQSQSSQVDAETTTNDTSDAAGSAATSGQQKSSQDTKTASPAEQCQ